MHNKKYLISISGPTAIGKTKLAIFLAEQLSTEIISCDSRQFYKEMKIGTAVPSQKELDKVPHHFIQHLSIFDNYSVGDFEKDALKKIDELFKTHDTLIMVGGSGLYEKAVTEGLDEFPEVDSSIREKLNSEWKEFGLEKLQQELEEVDPVYYEEVDLKNPIRIIRALEVYRSSGKPFSSFRIQNKTKRDFKIVKISLDLPREEIYERINRRVDVMMNEGLLKEAMELFPHKHLNSLQTVGYRELFNFFEGKTDLETAIEEIKKNTRRYSKRQLTWNRKDKSREWFSPKEKNKILNYILTQTQQVNHNSY